jgi:CIC family chloride channel protein
MSTRSIGGGAAGDAGASRPAPSSPRPGVGPTRLDLLRQRARLWRLYAIRFVLGLAPTEPQRLLLLTLAVGVTCGLAAVAFHEAIRLAERVFIERAMDTSRPLWPVLTVATPVVGAAIAGLLLQHVVPNARGSGIPQVKATFATPGARVRFRDAVGKFVLASLSIGTGSSLGREGPTVQICAGIASLLGRVARVSPRSARRLLPVGAAAGVAAAFNAPIAAVTFTVEEIVGSLDRSVLSGVIVAAAAAAAVERGLLGEDPVFRVPQGYALHHASSLVVYAMLGVAAAGVAVAFTDALLVLRARLRDAKGVSPWLRPAIGGLVTGLLAVIAMKVLGERGVTGGGYATLTSALEGQLAVRTLLALATLKAIATVFSYGTGGAGGIFAPSLFIGGMLGGAFGWVDMAWLGHDARSLGTFALVGMGAAFAGIVRAPMTSVLIIVEMTGGYSLILPLMIANMTAYGLARRIRPVPIYDALLEQDGIHLPDAAVRDALDGLRVASIAATDVDVTTFAPTTRLAEMVRAPASQSVFPVLDADHHLVGLVAQEDLELCGGELALLVNAADLMRTPFVAHLDDDVHVALATLLDAGLQRLPVVDDADRLVGFVDEAAITRAFFHGRARPHPHRAL